ncbi:nitrogen regulatory protein P-II [Methanococcus aeolicus Nankai-3]|uniref:Nitrogen regulatory protein P-II n=1 Tax=Methanococcus aeolicus (strain ATCC BAA-1280 / DSM 17508 / OCM 812 / Nankai-3) TaxID=419665 RepID=A6UW26_META3|nr:P-II family nitrogen regulator [Methanococcus aeolicus]ABR56698.1 nitrogen regulatory protein P-II [Methanococcus aeolicus Nankai-3]
MYIVEAIVRPEKTNAVIAALVDFGYKGEFILSEVTGQRQNLENTTIRNYRGHKFIKNTMKIKNKIELTINNEDLDNIINIIRNNAKTGEFGDGKIFVYDTVDRFSENNKDKNNDSFAEPVNSEREKLLRELRINLPDDDYVDSLLEEAFKPDGRELRDLEKIAIDKLNNDLFGLLKEQDILLDYKVDIEVDYNYGKYYYNCNIILIPKKTFGFIKKGININSIRNKSKNILNSINGNAEHTISIIVY